jgi:hypothetical protein
MSGNGKCQKRGRESFYVAVRLGFLDESFFVSRVQPQFYFSFFKVLRCLRKRLVVHVEKLDRWDVERYFVVLENLSGYTEGSSRQGEFRPKPLTEPYVIVSHHTALVIHRGYAP